MRSGIDLYLLDHKQLGVAGKDEGGDEHHDRALDLEEAGGRRQFIPTLLSIRLFYPLLSKTYFTTDQPYHEKYHAQKFL